MSDLINRFKATSMEHIIALAKPVLEEGRQVKFTVVGNSMFPVFRSNLDRVTLKKAEKVKKYDVVLYSHDDGNYVLHRIVGKGKLGYKLCGDNQHTVEYPVKRESVIAVMTAFERKGTEVSVNCVWYKLYCIMWCAFIPLRPFIFKIAFKIKKMFNRRK